MARIKVLAADDSTVARRFLAEAIGADPELELVALAGNGRVALDRIEATSPDVVVLDVEMPELDGLATLAEVKRRKPRLPVIMFSTHTERGAATTLDALALGASDYLHKPTALGLGKSNDDEVRAALIAKIKLLSYKPLQGKAPSSVRLAPRVEPARIEAVAIGVSTGGPNALAEVFRGFTDALPVPVFIVQHMPAVFTKRLAERLDVLGGMRVEEAAEGTIAVPGRAYVAPGDFHLTVEGDFHRPVLHLDQNEPENSCRPAADVLFRSVARVYGQRCLAVVLTGMGQDGLRGAELMRQNGASVIAQDEATSVVWGMPGSVVRARIASDVLPIEQVAGAIAQRASIGRSRSSNP
jgi:two-component system chemotaxis response regulator CheB